MMTVEEAAHKGVILDTSQGRFDSGASSYGTIFVDEEDPSIIYLFYTGAKDYRWSHTSIGLATSEDAINFRKTDELNPIFENQKGSFCARQALIPVVTRVGNHFYMILAGKSTSRKGRRIGMAHADDPKGPWKVVSELIRAERPWEGNDIDLGPCIAKINDNELIVYYSNTSNSWASRIIFGPRFLLRRIGILKLKINSPSNIEAYRYEGNPLEHLNGFRGNWNESIFCPGHLEIQDTHYLFPATSTYSIGFPFRQYIGITTDFSPYFQEPQESNILIDGPTEKKEIIPAIRSEIALDTPCPLLWKSRIFLYYSVMDRADNIWKTALTIFQIK